MTLTKNIFTALFIAILSIMPAMALTSGFAFAQEPDLQGNLCGGADTLQFGQQGDCAASGEQATDTVNSTVTLIINVFSWIVGVVSVLMIIWGGFKYITSGGDSNNVTAAKNTIMYAIIGLVIVALAQVIVRFVLGQATGQNG